MLYRVAASLLAGSLSISAFRPFYRSPLLIPARLLQSASNVSTVLDGRDGARLRGSKVVFAAASGPAYCEMCGTSTNIVIPDGDERERRVCSDPACGHIHYQNPKVVVGAVCTYNGKVLLCQRAIEPRAGQWGYPQGFLELGETTRMGAARETWEEAGVKFDPAKAELLAVYNLAGVQIQMIYRAELESDDFEAGHESSDVKFVPFDELDEWTDDLAFPTVQWCLEYAREVKDEVRPPVQERTKLVTMDGQWKVEEG